MDMDLVPFQCFQVKTRQNWTLLPKSQSRGRARPAVRVRGRRVLSTEGRVALGFLESHIHFFFSWRE